MINVLIVVLIAIIAVVIIGASAFVLLRDRRDQLVVDDRDVLDDGYGSALAAVDRLLAERPVYIVRRDKDLPAFEERFVLEKVESVPSPGTLYRVTGRQTPADPGDD